MTDRQPSDTLDVPSEPAVSVVVTNFNYGGFIKQSLTSVAEQHYDSLECIIVDDASTDGSVEQIEEFIRSSSKQAVFHLVKLERNGGQMNAMVEGFQRSTGEFVVFLDADDYLFPEFIATHVAAHLNPEYPAALTCSNERVVDGADRALAGTIEKFHRQARKRVRLSREMPVRATVARGETHVQLAKTFREGGANGGAILHIAPEANDARGWLWSTMSAVMFRRGVLSLVLQDRVRNIRVCADYYVLQYAHLLGGSLLITDPLGAYRRHGVNNFASNPLIGGGSRAGNFPPGFSRRSLLRRLESDILNDVDALQELLGPPRTVQLLAGFVSPYRAIEVLRHLRQTDWRLLLAYLVLAPLKAVKRAWLFLDRALRIL